MARKKNTPKKNQPVPSKNHIQTTRQVTQFQYQGPLPPASELAKYEEIIPGGADRLIASVEQQSAHRQEIEKKVIESDIENSRRGLNYGLIIGLASVIGGCACVMTGHEVGGTIIGGSGLTGLVGVFVYGSRERRKERESRLKIQKK